MTVTDAIIELREQEQFYNELYQKYKRDNYLAMATAYRIAARIVERANDKAVL